MSRRTSVAIVVFLGVVAATHAAYGQSGFCPSPLDPVSFCGCDSVSMECDIPANDNVALQCCANDASLAGSTLYLSGTYRLDPGPASAPAPNGGHLFLPLGMNLVGRNEYVDVDRDGVWDPQDWDGSTPIVWPAVCQGGANDGLACTNFPPQGCPGGECTDHQFPDPDTQTTVDGRDVPPVGAGPPAALIQVGLDNSVERLTVKWHPPYLDGWAPIGSTGSWNGGQGWRFSVSDCVVEGGDGGIDVLNLGPGLDGVKTRATLKRNIVRGGTGSRVMNLGTFQATVGAQVKRNRFYANSAGVVQDAGHFWTAVDSVAHVDSIGNRIHHNWIWGINVSGGIFSDGSQARLTSIGDAITHTMLSGVFLPGSAQCPAGVCGNVIISGAVFGGNGEADVRLIGTDLAGNPLHVLVVGGAYGATDSSARVLVRNVTSDPGSFVFSPSAFELNNQVTIIGNEVAFEEANICPDNQCEVLGYCSISGIPPLEWQFCAEDADCPLGETCVDFDFTGNGP